MATPDVIPPEHVATLIDQVLRSKDPATVGLKRILRKKEEERTDFPLRGAQLEEFSAPGRESKKLNAEERRMLELEKQLADMRIELDRQKTAAANAIQAAYAKGRKEGNDQGRTEGTAAATAVFDKKLDAVQKHVGDMIVGIETSKREIFNNAEHIILKLCCAMVRKVIDREVDEHREVVLAVLKRALTYIGHHEKMLIRVAPDDLEAVSGRRDFWFPVAQRLSDISIEADNRIEKGGCIVESNSGLVDARLGVQFNEISGLVEKIWDETVSAPVTPPAVDGPVKGV